MSSPDEELARVDAEINTLRDAAVMAHQNWVAADRAWRAAVNRRQLLVDHLNAAAPAPSGLRSRATQERATREDGASLGADARASEASARSTEASAKTVQNVLFVLGGLLLGTAAIAFTAVAWATFGVGGRAAILAIVTLIALAIPLVALSRQLRATAETFAAIGLLLVVLDGYAAWYVNLAGVQSLPGTRYTGIVALITATIALGYGRATRLTGPGFVAILAAQPVLLLLVAADHPRPAAVSLLCAGTAAADAIVAYRARRAPSARKESFLTRNSRQGVLSGSRTALIALAWFLFAPWAVGALLSAVVAAGQARTVVDAAVAGGGLVLASLLGLVAALYTRAKVALGLASGAVVLTVASAAVLVANKAWPGHALLVWALVAAALAGLVRSVWGILGEAFRSGTRIGTLVVTGLVASVTGVLSLVAAALTAQAAFPLWTASLKVTGPRPPTFTWELVAAIAVLAVALMLLSPRWSFPVTLIAAGVAAVLALPASVALPWWAPAVVALVGAAVLAVVGVLQRSTAISVAALFGGAVLLGFAILTGAARPGLTAVVLAGTGAIGIAVGVRQPGGLVNRIAISVGLVAIPPAIGAALVAGHVLPWWAARATVAAVVVLAAAVAVLRRRIPTVWPGAAIATLASAVLWPIVAVAVSDDALAVHMGVSLVLIAVTLFVLADVPAALGGALGAASVPAIGLAIAVAPALVAVVAYPWSWYHTIWAGIPSGVGLSPGRTPDVTLEAAIGLALLALAAALALYAGTHRIRSALAGLSIGGPSAVLIALAAESAPWPVMPAATLVIGLVMVVAAALANQSWRTTLATFQGIVYIGAGVAGSLVVEWATMTALGLVIVAAAIVGTVGATVEWRVLGLITAVGVAALEGATAGFAADRPTRDVGVAVLGVGIVALFLGALMRGPNDERKIESTATQAAAHATGVVSLLFTIGWLEYTAGLSAAWGLAIGVRALLPRTSRSARARLAAVAAGFELLAWWLLLVNRGVTLVEAYTLPLSAVALLAGWAALRSRPDLRSWVAYGPALAAAFLPSLAAIITTTGDPWRRLALGAGALVVVVIGASARRQAPVVLGGVVLALVALHELVLLWQLLPGWVPLAIGGVILVGLAITYERRLRDLSRLRTALGRMT